MKSKARIHFEQNMLDGDDVNNCGGAMLSAKSVLEYIEENMYPLAQQEILDRAIKLFEPTPEYLKCMKVMSENGTMCAMCGFCPMKAKELLSTLKDTNI